MRKLTPQIVDAIRNNAVLLGKFAAHLGLKPATVDIYLRDGKLKKLSTPAAEQFIRRRLKLPAATPVITETDQN